MSVPMIESQLICSMEREREEIFCISTPPISQAWISTEFRVHRRLRHNHHDKPLRIPPNTAADPSDRLF
ncbi:hypothetical protein CCACVL1_08182 [Corchorus capsularis]|uniref:Uncharacterized protein n=1 Tax=Corchorus capsularis TaxID=210143 RepID=A0A1R3J207_COCAP|nr:hypothetical protein CCACVL1_08182 [Corchorus capsularis]